MEYPMEKRVIIWLAKLVKYQKESQTSDNVIPHKIILPKPLKLQNVNVTNKNLWVGTTSAE
jgi:hypothetical protein